MKENLFYVVLACHDAGPAFRKVAHVICATKLPAIAIKVAREVEKHGYKFCSDENFVAVYELKENECYSFKIFRFRRVGENVSRGNFPIILFSQKKDGKWKEEWFDKEMKNLFKV